MAADRINERDRREHGLDDTYYEGWSRREKGAPDLAEEPFVHNRYNEALKKAHERQSTEATNADTCEHGDDPRLEPEILDEAFSLEGRIETLPTWERGRSTELHVFDEDGQFLKIVKSGRTNVDRSPDMRVQEADEIIQSLDWGLKPDQKAMSNEHAEVKLAVDIIQGRMPRRISFISNNQMCQPGEQDYTCGRLLDEALPDDSRVSAYDPTSDSPVTFPRPIDEQGGSSDHNDTTR